MPKKIHNCLLCGETYTVCSKCDHQFCATSWETCPRCDKEQENRGCIRQAENVFELGFRHGKEGRRQLTNAEAADLLDGFNRPSTDTDVMRYVNGARDGRKGDTFRLDKQRRLNQSGVCPS